MSTRLGFFGGRSVLLRHAQHWWRRSTIRFLHPARLVLLGYLTYVLAGWLLLCMPCAQARDVAAIDNLFISTSAVSTTGLVTISVSQSYTAVGQAIVLTLIQLGGIGYMTFSSFLILSRRRELPSGRATVMHAVFTLPQSFRLNAFIIGVIAFTAAIELLGVAALYPLLRAAGDPQPLWSAVFHSVSAFCTAGFSLYDSSFEAHAGGFWINMVIGVLSYLGAIGFIVCLDAWHMFIGRTRRMTMTSRIILWATLWLTLAGTALIFLAEPTVRSMPVDQRLLASWFQCMTAMTTVGFNTIPIGSLSRATLLLIVVLMVIGASPSGTGGGLKSTTLTILLGVMRSAVRGQREVTFWGRPIPFDRIWSAFAGLGFYLMALLVGAYLLELTETNAFERNLFEAASALGTVGLSTGITASLSAVGKLIIIGLMFCGRVGPATFGMAMMFRPPRRSPVRDQDVAV